MKRVVVIPLLLGWIGSADAQQLALHPWTEVFGTVQGEALGRNVSGVPTIPGFPYRAAVSRNFTTEFLRLQTPSDTAAQVTFNGVAPSFGDLNGDGFTDMVLRLESLTSDVDTVSIHWGTISGFDTIAPIKLTGSNTYEDFGRRICLGNLLGDSTIDLVITAPQYTLSTAQGRLYIYEGGSQFDTVPDLTIDGDSVAFGLGRACAVCDPNDDGYNDLLIRGIHQAPPRFDYVDIYFGAASGIDSVRDLRLTGPEINAPGLLCFDVNADGVGDLLWTTRDTIALENSIYVHFGRHVIEALPDIMLNNPGVADFGKIIVNAGDMNGDSNTDIAVGAPRATITSGFVWVFGGGPQIDSIFDAAVGMSADAQFGWDLASMGDINGDGLSDMIIGAPTYDFGTNKGYWGIFLGDTAIKVTDVREESAVPKEFRLFQSYPNPFNPRTTIRYELAVGAVIHLEVSNTLGQKVVTLADGYHHPGLYQEVFDASALSSGTYYYTLTVTTDEGCRYSDTEKIILIR